MKTLAVLAVLALATPVAALADPAAKAKPEAGAAAAPAAASSKEKLVCRRENVTGSRTHGVRTCLTREQWRTLERTGSVEVRRETSGAR